MSVNQEESIILNQFTIYTNQPSYDNSNSEFKAVNSNG